MYAALRHLTLREILTTEGPSLAAALVIAELFYKFGSFSLECVAFLVTWLVLSAFLRVIVLKRAAPRKIDERG